MNGTPASQGDFAALDFECTGPAPGFQNTPWQIGIVRVTQGHVDMSRSFSSLLRVPPEQPFNPYTPGRWAQLRPELAAAPTPQELWPCLREFLCGVPLVAHNTPTERTFLTQLFPLQPFGPWLDTLPLARRAFPRQRDYKLENLIPNLGLAAVVAERCPGGAPHDALYDAVACASLLELVVNAPGWQNISTELLITLH